MADAKRGFQTPPEITGYFDRKELRPGFSWKDVWGEEHAYAFTVAKATELELLTLFRRSIGEAIAKGQGFETWRQAILPELQKIGWGTPRLVADPTGQAPDRMVDFTAPRRLQTIFWGNTASARAAGQWDRAQRTKAVLPYLVYIRSASARPREQHLRWVGIIRPIDDPWWATHFPPNGWNCKCSVRQIDGRERGDLLDRAPAAETDPSYTDEIPVEPPRTWVNSRTGEMTTVPAGIDPGWQTNPGRLRQRARVLAEHLDDALEAADPDLARVAVRDIVAGPIWQQHHASALQLAANRKAFVVQAEATGVPRSVIDHRLTSDLAWPEVPVAIGVAPPSIASIRPDLKSIVVARDWGIGHSIGRHSQDPSDWARIQEILDRGEVHIDPRDPNRISLFARFATGEWVLFLKALTDRWQVASLFGNTKPNYRANHLAKGKTIARQEIVGGGP